MDFLSNTAAGQGIETLKAQREQRSSPMPSFEKRESGGRTDKRDSGLRGCRRKFLVEGGEWQALTASDIEVDGVAP